MKLRGASLLVVSSVLLSTAQGQLKLVLTGEPGSPVVHYTTSGSVTASEPTQAVGSSSASRLPDSGLWEINFDNDLGDFLTDFALSENDNLLLSNPVPIFVNGVQLDNVDAPNAAVFDTIDLDPRDISDGDDVEFDPVVEIAYPELAVGDVVSWGETCGTFTLESGNFEEIFDTMGTFLFSDVFELVIRENGTRLRGLTVK